MSEILPDDPMLNIAYNAGLEWAANWITGSQSLGHSEETVEFARNMAMSIRAARRKVNQVDFFDAIRADPYMPAAQKEFWLSKSGPTTGAVDGLPVPPKVSISKFGERLTDLFVKFRRH
jgi:hypothetical protein